MYGRWGCKTKPHGAYADADDSDAESDTELNKSEPYAVLSSVRN
jgi:hypothetical protein